MVRAWLEAGKRKRATPETSSGRVAARVPASVAGSLRQVDIIAVATVRTFHARRPAQCDHPEDHDDGIVATRCGTASLCAAIRIDSIKDGREYLSAAARAFWHGPISEWRRQSAATFSSSSIVAIVRSFPLPAVQT